MLTEDLFSKILIEPALKSSASTLRIVSGFATASMADRHLKQLNNKGVSTSVELIVGMGIETAQHKMLCKLASSKRYGLDFKCRYVVRPSSIHAKSYVWLNDEGPFVAFCGSANYTRLGFSKSQIEAMEQTEAVEAHRFYQSALRNSINCLNKDVPEKVLLRESRRLDNISQDDEDAETVRLSLLVRATGETHKAGGGLNWGQRKGRDKNQAYIPVPVGVQKSNFFPERGEQFTVLTDDEDSFICVRAQANGKGLQTTHSNAELGSYLRRRMGLESGTFVTKNDLLNYGRTDVSFTKINPETYRMDFSVSHVALEEDVESKQD